MRTGIMTITAKGVGYLKNPLFEEDWEIAPELLNCALHGDEVEADEYPRSAGNTFANSMSSKTQAKVLGVTKRAKTHFVGTIEEDNGKAFLVPDDKRMYVDLLIQKEETMGATHGTKVFVEMKPWTDSKQNPQGVVKKIIGEKGNNDAEMESIVLERGFDTDFPPEVLHEAHLTELNERAILPHEVAKRRDMRGTFTATIDPFDAKDFDDALSIKKINDDLYEIGIHIADVSHYVREGTSLDKEARKRAFSVYLVDRTIPMLPHVLSNDVCSLNPHEDKLTFSAVFEMTVKGEIKNKWFGRTVIHSDKRFSYEEAQDVLNNKGNGEGAEFFEKMNWFNTIAYALRDEKTKNGAIDFETTEIKFKLDETGKPIEVIKKERLDTHRLVEEFMLLANREVAEFIFRGVENNNKGKGSHLGVYRIHDVPDHEKLAELSLFLKALGYDLDTKKDITPKDIQKLLKQVEGDPNEALIKTATIRSMAKAVYSTRNIGHFGLAFTYYTHFTSPIRRYPDLAVHRILQEVLHGKIMTDREAALYTRICLESSEQEVKAAEAERASIKYKQVEYMIPRLGQVFSGKISGVTEWGLYVQEETTMADGMIKLRDLKDDFYSFDQKSYSIIGQQKKKKYTLGDPIKFKIMAADLERKTLDCVLAE